MAKSILEAEVLQVLSGAQKAANSKATKTIQVGPNTHNIPFPFPSPADWRDHWIYFLMIDRFNNPAAPPSSELLTPPIAWNNCYDFRQGGTFKGIQQQLEYIASLGAGAIWISPVLKNPNAVSKWGYHGYAAQDFLEIDGRFASDGSSATAEKELIELVEEAHARGLYIILDIVLNHTARVFDYQFNHQTVTEFQDAGVMNGSLGSEPAIEWIDASGNPRPDWVDTLPPETSLSDDDAVWPLDLQEKNFFRRRGSKLTDKVDPGGFVKGDFGSMRQLVVEYDATTGNQQGLREKYGKTPVLHILITIHEYLIAKFDLDGFRIDTVKYVDPQMVQTFGNAIREYALSIGKRNFFTFGEVYDDENTIKYFIGRNGNSEGFGIDAALDFPLFFKLPKIAKAQESVSELRVVFVDRKDAEEELLSSHGEAGRFFVTFLDNHDQHHRFKHPLTPAQQVLIGITIQFCLQGIPCLYYGTEQGLDGAKDAQGHPNLNSLESTREALWGKQPIAFDKASNFYQNISALSVIRRNEPSLRYGRLYFRQVSGNKKDFGHSFGLSGIVAFSRILANTEILVVANTSSSESFQGFVLMDLDIANAQKQMQVSYSNLGTSGRGSKEIIEDASVFGDEGTFSVGKVAALFIKLAPMEVQILVPVRS